MREAERASAADGGQHFVAPNFGFALFERAWSLRGFDQLLMDLVDQPAWVEELFDRITNIQVTLAKRFIALGSSRRKGVLPKRVAQTSKSAVSQVSKPAQRECSAIPRSADMDVGDTAGLETCATVGQHALTSAATESKSRCGVDGGYFGDDYGAQRGLLFSPRLWRQLIKPRLAKMFAVFRDTGLPVILHSDGDIWPILANLVDIGLTCLNPVQPEVLDHRRLYREFGQHLSFYGGISTQEVLPKLSPAGVQAATRACLQALAPDGTGLILGPSHRMQSDIPAENVAAMLSAFPDAGGITQARKTTDGHR